jgi:IS5 family transposase
LKNVQLGVASIKNTEFCIDKGIVNVVFNKVVGSMKNVASSLRLETMLKEKVAQWH